MMYTIHSWCDSVFQSWQGVAPADFLPVALGIVLLIWYTTRQFSR